MCVFVCMYGCMCVVCVCMCVVCACMCECMCVCVCVLCVCVCVCVCVCGVCECGMWHSRESAPSPCSIKLVHICVGGCYSLSNQTER